MSTTPMTKIREWEEEFDEKFIETKDYQFTDKEGYYWHKSDFKMFISKVIQQELSSLEGEIENSIRDKVTGGFPGEMEMNIEIATYNEAVRDVLSIIRQHKEGYEK